VEPLEQLLAIEEIRRLKARYFRALDLKEWDRYGELFTTPTVIDFSDQPELWGHGPEDQRPDPADWIFTDGKACADAIEPLFEGVITTHHGHDPDIEITGETTAAGIWSLYDRLEFPEEIFHGFGHYRDEYEKVDGTWLISKLVLTRLRCAWEIPAVAAES
jgi:hypothetical protein